MNGDLARLLDELEAAHGKATPGRWRAMRGDLFDRTGLHFGGTIHDEDAAFAAAAHEALPTLIAELRRRDEALARVRELAETWTRYPQSPEDRERNRYGAAMEDCGNSLAAALAAHEQAEEAR